MTAETDGSRDGRGPFSWAATAWSDAHGGTDADERRRARERASGARPETASKRSLVAVSHAIERAVLAGPVEQPTVVVALFQQLPYFERERAVYESMVAAGVEVVLAFAAGEEFPPPDGAHLVLLDPDEPLVDEWSVVAVGPRAGAFLVATDRHEFDPRERELEPGRRFSGRWGYARTQAAVELARLRLALGGRLPADAVARIDGLLARALPSGGQVATSSGTPGETWATTSLHDMVDRMHTARAGHRQLREQLADAHRAMTARAAASVDPHSGLTNPDFLHRWSGAGGTTALPIGLGLFDVPELEAAHARYDARAAFHAARRVAAALTEPLGPVDAAVRLSEREFLVVLPGASARHLAAVCDDIGEQLELSSEGYPGIPLRARTATIVTRSRPLPLGDLHEALSRLDPGQTGPVDAGRTPSGDRLTVASTGAQRRAAHAWVDAGIPPGVDDTPRQVALTPASGPWGVPEPDLTPSDLTDHDLTEPDPAEIDGGEHDVAEPIGDAGPGSPEPPAGPETDRLATDPAPDVPDPAADPSLDAPDSGADPADPAGPRPSSSVPSWQPGRRAQPALSLLGDRSRPRPSRRMRPGAPG